MAFIEWDDSFSIDISEIDKQHQKLFALINELADAIHGDADEHTLRRIANGLVNYIDVHFSNEEDYFDQFGYAETQEHKKEHAYFVQRVLEFMDEFEQGNLDISTDMMKFLSDWLITHIKGSDRKYAPFLIAKGVK
jgi:hemerythrin-like metal-binding protein